MGASSIPDPTSLLTETRTLTNLPFTNATGCPSDSSVFTMGSPSDSSVFTMGSPSDSSASSAVF